MAKEHMENCLTSFIIRKMQNKTLKDTNTHLPENLLILEYQTILPAFWEICVQVKKQHLELNMEQQTGSKSGKE